MKERVHWSTPANSMACNSVKAREMVAQDLDEKGLGGKRISYPVERLGHIEAAVLGSTHSHRLLQPMWNRARS